MKTFLVATLLVMCAEACTRASTQLLVEVDTDFVLPSQLTRIEMRTVDSSGATIATAPFELLAREARGEPGKYVLPLSFAFVPKDGDVNRSVVIQLSG